MAKVLIVITDDTYVRNYLRTTALHALRRNHECFIVAHRGLSLAEEVSKNPGFHGFYDLNPVLEKRHRLFFNLLMWRNRKKSKTFFYRWLRNSDWHLIRRTGNPLQRTASYLHWFGAALLNPRGFRIPLLANRVTFPLISPAIRASLKPNPSVRRLIEDQGFDVLVFPSAAFDSVSVDIVAIGNELKIPTLCLIDNWDNLSSKTVFWRRPDHLAVWGPQTKAQAEEIHGFTSDRVHLLGTPRFDSYFEARNRPPPAPYDFPYGLYVGSAMPFDDVGTLRRLEKLVAGSSAFPPNFRLVYRPHPWQHKRNTDAIFRPEEFSRVILDTQFVRASEGKVPAGTNDPAFQPDLDYYPGLLFSSRFVVGPLTTMLFEASLCLRPVIALSYFDGHHVNTSRRYFSHFEGMERVPGFIFCTDHNALKDLIGLSWHHEPLNAEQSDVETAFYLYRDAMPYGERLNSIVASICSLK